MHRRPLLSALLAVLPASLAVAGAAPAPVPLQFEPGSVIP